MVIVYSPTSESTQRDLLTTTSWSPVRVAVNDPAGQVAPEGEYVHGKVPLDHMETVQCPGSLSHMEGWNDVDSETVSIATSTVSPAVAWSSQTSTSRVSAQSKVPVPLNAPKLGSDTRARRVRVGQSSVI